MQLLVGGINFTQFPIYEFILLFRAVIFSTNVSALKKSFSIVMKMILKASLAVSSYKARIFAKSASEFLMRMFFSVK